MSTTVALGGKEGQCFDWFKSRTVKKLPGLFILTFWDKLLVQASQSEPAVLHAVLTLGSVHMGKIVDDDRREDLGKSGGSEHFTLENYSKAISQLRPHFGAKDRSSTRVALITCLVFVCLEYLRGYFRTAQTHLENGLKVLGEMQGCSTVDTDRVLLFKPFRESIDDAIFDTFCRLQIQVMLFKQSHLRPYVVVMQDSQSELPRSRFLSLNQAWKRLQQLLNEIFCLERGFHNQRPLGRPPPKNPTMLLDHQQHIRTELIRWLEIYNQSRESLQIQHGRIYETFAYHLLRPYHAMGVIMLEACQALPDDQTEFDKHTNQFLTLIEQSTCNWKTKTSRSGLFELPAVPGQCAVMSRSVIDTGWIPPLYYTIIKCRVHRIRLQAARLLEFNTHREGIWDSSMIATAARKVMEIEEQDFYCDLDIDDDFHVASTPSSRDLSLPVLPPTHRIHDVEVVLPDGPMDTTMSLRYKRKQDDGSCQVFTNEFDFARKCWMRERAGELVEEV
jgi:hypothetical protein